MPPTILIAAALRDLLGDDPVEGCRVRWLEAHEPTPAGDYPAIISLLTRRLGTREFAALPHLRVVANCAVGIDNVDLEAARARGVTVTNTPGVLTDATADLTWGLILAVVRRLKEGQALIASGAWDGWHPTQLLGLELRNSTLGVVGAGRIGQAVARRGAAFGMRLLYTARSPKPQFDDETGAARVDLAELLAESDVVSLHLPSTAETRGLIDARRFRQMAKVPVVVNTARGDLIDVAALLDALETGRASGAGLDVFPAEPQVPRALVEHPRVVVLPHIGSATTATRRAMAELAAANVRAVLERGEAVTPVGP